MTLTNILLYQDRVSSTVLYSSAPVVVNNLHIGKNPV
jgi:hypothetical protein